MSLRRDWAARETNHPALAALAISFAGMLLFVLLQGPKPFYYDAANYWALGSSFTVHGHFSLLNYSSPTRGYLFPLVNHFLLQIGNGLSWSSSTMVKIFNCFLFALIGTVLGPEFAQAAWPEHRWGLTKRIALATLVFVFWDGYTAFPLTDFPALAAVLLALIGVARNQSPGWMFTAGLASAIALNLRPSYEPLPLAMAALVAAVWLSAGQWRSRAVRCGVCLACALIGFALISLPQSLVTHRHFGSWSFIPGSVANVAGINYTEGLELQRYDTYVGTSEAGPEMLYVYPAGAKLLAQVGGAVTSLDQYAHIAFDHPRTILGLFIRHTINGLDERYDTPYLAHVGGGAVGPWRRVAGFLLVFLAIVRVAWPDARRKLGKAWWRYPVALVVSGMTWLISVAEPRYLLPVVLLSYLLVMTAAWPNPLGGRADGTRRFLAPVMIGIGLVVFALVVLSVVRGATAHLRFA